MAEKAAAKRSRFGLLTGLASAVILVPALALGVFFATFDPDKYRSEISGFLSDKLGRKVSLNGPMHLKLAGGLALDVNDVVIANPSWATRPDMAKIGEMTLAIKLRGLLQSPRKLEVEKITLADADVQLETGPKDAKNWEFAQSKLDRPAAPEPEKGDASAPILKKEPKDQAVAAGGQKMPLDIAMDQLLIRNVRFAMVDGGKKQTTEVRLKELKLEAKDKTALKAEGSFNQQPFSAALDGAVWQDLLAEKAWPFKAQAQFMGNDFAGGGQLGKMGKQVQLTDFKLVSSIGSTITGKIAADLTGVKPNVTGNLLIDGIKAPEEKGAAAPAAAPAVGGAAVPAGGGRLFSDQKFDLAPLKAANADLKIAIGKITAGKFELENTQTEVKLKDGVLRLPELVTLLAGNRIEGNATVNANNNNLAFGLRGSQLNLQPVLQNMGMGNVAVGKAGFVVDGSSSGDSPRAVASNLGGRFNFNLGPSQIDPNTLGPVLNNLLKLISPGSPLNAQHRLTCATARFSAQNGVMTSNGILLDSSLATVAGAGTINLGNEQLNMQFQPRTKDQALGGFTAPLTVTGSLAKPAFALDAQGAVANIAGEFLGAKLPAGGKANLRVPLVNAASADPCNDALDHPNYPPDNAAPTSAAGVAVNKGKEAVQEKVRGALDKALGGDNANPALKELLGGEKSPLKGLFGGE